MSYYINDWAQRWNIPPQAVAELRALSLPEAATAVSGSEAANSQHVRLAAANNGDVLWRNNVGAAVTDTGRHIRYGLANDSKRMNARVKSSDLIGIRRVLITQEMVGSIIGQFVAIETKSAKGRTSGTERAGAQQRFLDIVNAHGGHGCFSRGEYHGTS